MNSSSTKQNQPTIKGSASPNQLTQEDDVSLSGISTPENVDQAFKPQPRSSSYAMTDGLGSGVAQLPDSDVTNKSVTLDKYILGGAEYAVPISLLAYQRQLYEQVIILHSTEILKFTDFETQISSFRDGEVENMHKVLNLALLAATHPYLVLPSLLPKNLSDKDEARYIAAAGEKFRILDMIVAVFKEKGLKLGVVAREDKTLALVADFLSCRKYKFVRQEGVLDIDTEVDHASPDAFAKATVVLVPSSSTKEGDDRERKFSLPKVDLVIAIDASFDVKQPQVRQLRGDFAGTEKLSPVIRLVPVNTFEHSLLSAAKVLGTHDSVFDSTILSSIFTTTVLVRHKAGILSEAISKEVDNLASRIPDWLKNSATRPFPVSVTLPLSLDPNDPAAPSDQYTLNEITPDDLSNALESVSEHTILSQMLDAIEADASEPPKLTLEATIKSIISRTRKSLSLGVKEVLVERSPEVVPAKAGTYDDDDNSRNITSSGPAEVATGNTYSSSGSIPPSLDYDWDVNEIDLGKLSLDEKDKYITG
ncbi:class II histone deacetylase complex subunits 2 and 3-domain-containing protein [Lipomyces japonicus]|uniref:class II histone deacetylase complex subunits 2 and 3-domain-containing protein n=1 Tax=Lipomyces japonicus TaxID=56871 RepID=UPI0034CE40A8